MAEGKRSLGTSSARVLQRVDSKVRGCVISLIICFLLTAGSIPLIWIFARFVLPGFTGDAPKITQAENDAFDLKNSISCFFIEYRKFPVDSQGGDTISQSVGELTGSLLGDSSEGESSGTSPRGISFLSGRQAEPLPYGGWRNGITLGAGGDSGLFDPWGNPYWVKMNTNGSDGFLAPDRSGEIDETIAVWSAGPDGDPDTWEDNIRTW